MDDLSKGKIGLVEGTKEAVYIFSLEKYMDQFKKERGFLSWDPHRVIELRRKISQMSLDHLDPSKKNLQTRVCPFHQDFW